MDAATGPIDWSGYRDDTAQQLERLVDAKVAGREPVAAADEEPVQVIQLLTALRESVAAQKGSKVRSRQTKRSARRRSA
jgi:non-homologous end joining protein Ku